MQFRLLVLSLVLAGCQETTPVKEAEPHKRAAVRLAQTSDEEAAALNNLAQVLQDTNRLEEAEPLMRRALAIDEASFGPEHPNVARDLNNLAGLLQATNRLDEADTGRSADSLRTQRFTPCPALRQEAWLKL